MLRSGFDDADNQRLEITPLLDALYNDDVWVRDVQRKVRDLATPRQCTLTAHWAHWCESRPIKLLSLAFPPVGVRQCPVGRRYFS